MANNIFPNDLNSAPLCTICFHKVVDDAKRSITKLICGHYFHADCSAVEFNVIGLMKCPNCEVVEEDGLWMKVANSEDGESSDEDEDEECNNEDQYNEPEDGDINLLHTTNDAHNGGASHMSFTWHEMTINNVQRDGRNIFSDTFVDGNAIIQQNEWRQQLHVPPPLIAFEMIDRRIFVSGLNIVPDPVSHESPTLYEQTRNNVLPCLELTLATRSTSISGERPPPPCQCISYRASSSKMH